MVWKSLRSITFAALLMAAVTPCSWAVPGLMTYQGMLTDTQGVPVDGTVTMDFLLYAAPAGGEPLWQETPVSVEVVSGVYNVNLGSATPLRASVIGDTDTLYLEVRVLNPDTLWETLQPRQRLTSTAYAIKAEDAQTLNGLDSSALDQSAHVGDSGNPHGVTAAQVGAVEAQVFLAHSVDPAAHHTKTTSFSELSGQATDAQIPNNITINYAATAGSATSATSATSAGDADTLDGMDSTAFVGSGGGTMTGALILPSNGLVAGTNQLVLSGGNVGIGTASPGSMLDVGGDISTSGVLRVNGARVFEIPSVDSTFIGYGSGGTTTSGHDNTFIGFMAGRDNHGGSNNTYVGCEAGMRNEEGYYNTVIGDSAGRQSTGSSNVFIGSFAGYGETGSDKLYIENSSASDPLIYGEFDNDLLRINGNLSVTSDINTNGKLGIGTIPSEAKLHIKGNGFPDSFAYFDTQAVDQDTGIRFYENGVHKGGIYHSATKDALDLVSINGTDWHHVLLQSDGKVGINATPNCKLHVDSSSGEDAFRAQVAGSTKLLVAANGGVSVGLNTTPPANGLYVNGNARFANIGSGTYSAPVNQTSDGTLTTSTSDRRLKTNIENIEDGLEIVMALQGVRFNWKKDPTGKPMIGLIAQEAENIVPELTFTNPVDGYMGINYAELTAVLIEAVKEQQQTIDQLGVRLGELEKRNTAEIASLKAQITRLQTMIEIAMAQKVDGQEDGGKVAENISR